MQKPADKSLMENRWKFQINIDSSPTGICIVELESGIIFDANKSFLETYEYTKEEVLGHSTTDLGIIGPEERKKYIAELTKQGYLKNREQVTYSKSGKQLTVYFSDLIIDHSGKKYCLTMLNDITENKKIVSTLVENKTKLQAIFDFNPGGIALFDLETGKILELNHSFTGICGYTREEMLNRTLAELGIFTSALRADIKQELTETGIIRNREQVFLTKKGKLRTVLYSSIVIYIGARKCTLDIVNDITERKELENQLIVATEKAQEAIKSEKRFLANMSHEIRTPMNGIIGMVNLLSETSLNTDQKEYVEWIKDSSEILVTIINDILDISKINAGQMVFEQTPFRIYDVLRTLTLSMELKAKEKNIGFRTQMDCRVPEKVVGDSVRLLQVLLNLTDNAMKFTEKGEVNISINRLREDDENIYLEFVVLDTGIGIEPEKIPGLFEPFVQATLDTTRKYGGTGLGLSIAKRLVEMQGGTINAESQLGLGSAFSFRIGYKKHDTEAERPAVVSREEQIYKSDISGLKVLLVEDNKISQRVGVKTMSKWGVEVDVAENGKQAVEMAIAHPYDVILMDIQMPVMDGFEATKQIRNSFASSVSKVPIIAMTASVILLDKEKSIEFGMDNYLSKPFKPEELYKILCDACPVSFKRQSNNSLK